jgi:hypothetical protein
MSNKADERLPDSYVSQVAKILVEKYPKPTNVSMMSNMGNSILFSYDAKVEDVRKWLGNTKFRRVSARRYVFDAPNGIFVEAEIEKQTYGFFTINFNAKKKMIGDERITAWRENMNRELVAQELVKIAKEVIGASEYVSVGSLPFGVQNAVKRVYGRRDIDITEATAYTPSMATSGWEGNRGFLMIVDIRTGRIEESQQGSWGGSNPFESNPIDVDDKHYQIPNGKIVLYGSTGGRGNFAHILVRPDDKISLVGDNAEAPQGDLTDDEKKALLAIKGIKSGYRADEFRRKGLGEYSVTNPLVKALEQKGLLEFRASGILITTAGKNAAMKIRGW